MRLPAGTFLVADLSASGDLQRKSEYRYDLLLKVPGAAELIGAISGNLWRSPEEFDEPLDQPRSPLRLRWRSSADTSGIATLRLDGELISITLLCSGISEDGDRITLEALQTHLLRELRNTGYEPAFGLMDLQERPLAATLNFHNPQEPLNQALAALADRCFAAAYFRFRGLA